MHEDLSHWDSIEEFTASELAALITGFDPNDPAAPHFKAKAIMKVVAEGHRVARAMVTRPILGDEFKRDRVNPGYANALVSVKFDAFPLNQKEPWPGDPGRIYDLPRQLQGTEGDLDQQRFARAEIARWLRVMGIRSKYQFIKDSTAPIYSAVEQAPAGGITHTINRRNRAPYAREIKLAQARLREAEQFDYQAVWDTLEDMAREVKDGTAKHGRLTGETGGRSEGVEYRDGTRNMRLTYEQLSGYLRNRSRTRDNQS